MTDTPEPEPDALSGKATISAHATVDSPTEHGATDPAAEVTVRKVNVPDRSVEIRVETEDYTVALSPTAGGVDALTEWLESAATDD